MPLDPQAKALEDAARALGRPPLEQQTPEQARAYFDAAPRAPGPDIARFEDRMVPGPEGDIPVRVYWPDGDPPLPVLVYFHGGGWVVGNIEANDGAMRHIVTGAGCAVVSVDYRLAPEHKFPAPVEDCYAATKWVAENAAAIGVDPSRIAVGGASAGGNLAAAVPLMARDRGSPPIVHQALIYPVIDRDFTRPSYLANGRERNLTTPSMAWYWKQYVRADEDAENPYAAPIRAETLRGLPAALVITAEYDPLRDEGTAYAKRLSESGVPTTHSDYPGMTHGFFSQWHQIDRGRDAIAEVCSHLRNAFGTQR